MISAGAAVPTWSLGPLPSLQVVVEFSSFSGLPHVPFHLQGSKSISHALNLSDFPCCHICLWLFFFPFYHLQKRLLRAAEIDKSNLDSLFLRWALPYAIALSQEWVMSHHTHTSQGLGCGTLGVIPRNSAHYNLVSGLDFTIDWLFNSPGPQLSVLLCKLYCISLGIQNSTYLEYENVSYCFYNKCSPMGKWLTFWFTFSNYTKSCHYKNCQQDTIKPSKVKIIEFS